MYCYIHRASSPILLEEEKEEGSQGQSPWKVFCFMLLLPMRQNTIFLIERALQKGYFCSFLLSRDLFLAFSLLRNGFILENANSF